MGLPHPHTHKKKPTCEGIIRQVKTRGRALCGRGACHPWVTNRLQEGNSDAKTNTRDGCSWPLAPNNSAMHSIPLLNKFLHLILNLAFQQQLARFCACNSLPTHMYLSAMLPASQAAVCPLLGTHTTVAGHTTTMQNFEENGQGQHDPHPLEKAGAHCSHCL